MTDIKGLEPKKMISLEIEKLAGLGDGVGLADGRRIFVPYTLPGDRISAHIDQWTKNAVYASLERVLAPGEGRIAPVCRHFADCGGCALQHLGEDLYRDFKYTMAREAVRKAGFDPAITAPLLQLPAASRRRAELKIRGGKLGYYAARSHRLVDIEECRVLEPALETLILGLKPHLTRIEGLAGLQVNGVDDGYDMLLQMSPGAATVRLPPDFLPRGFVIRLSVKGDAGLHILSAPGPVTLTLGGVKVFCPPGAFMQASREAQDIMTRYVVAASDGSRNLLDLFAGLGTYSFPLARTRPVTALEGDGGMAAAMAAAAGEHGVTLSAEVRDLFRFPVTPVELAPYDMVVINPPRTGAKEQATALADSKVKKIVMVSCNPATFTRDARILREGGYRLLHAQPIDQFVYSAHLEIMSEFAR